MRYAKFWTALAAAVTVGVSLTADGSISVNDGFAMAAALLGSLVVYAVPNQPAKSTADLAGPLPDV